MGAVNPSAVTSAKGARLIAMKKPIMHAELRTARHSMSPGREVRSGAQPNFTNQGTIANNANKLRKNAISKGWISLETCRISTCMAAMHTPAPSMSAIPLSELALGGSLVMVVIGWLSR